MAKDGLVSLSRATELIEQIAAALQAAHLRGRTVFQLEPSTILVTEAPEDNRDGAGRTRVIGLAPRKDPLPVATQDASQDPAEVVTTRAPETPPLAIEDPAQQVFLAAIAYEMLAGCSPFAEDAGDEAGDKAGEEATTVGLPDADATPPRPAPAALSEMVVGVSPALDEVFRRGLSPDPQQRFATLDDLVVALRALVPADAESDMDNLTVVDQPSPLRLLPPTGEAIVWMSSTDEPIGYTPPLAQTPAKPSATVETQADDAVTVVRGRTPAPTSRTPTPRPIEPGAPVVLASLPVAERPSRRTQVSFLAATLIILIAAIGIMSGSRKKVGAEEPAAESVAAPVRPIIVPTSRPTQAAPGRPAAPSPPTAEPEVSNDSGESNHRRSRRHAMHRPRAPRR
jgi:hypothetical protein